jgi:hypothetical protein
MADVTGPISTLPGASHAVPDGMECDYHPGVQGVARVQGETDSFGCEMEDICQQCIDQRRAYRCSDAGKAEALEARTGKCDWCKESATDLREARDYDEGMYGPVYRVCGSCITRRNKRLEEELDRYSSWDDWD